MFTEREVHQLRRITVGALVLALGISAFAAVPASAETGGGGITVTFNGHPVLFDVTPQIMNSRTMVPFRKIFEAMGAKVSYDGDTRTVTGIRGNTTVTLQIDNTSAQVNGNSTELDAAPTIVSGRTLVPVRFIAESMGVEVTWDGDNRVVKLVDRNYPHRGGTIQLAEWSAPKGKFNPLVQLSAYDAYITTAVFDQLVLLDDKLNPYPNLASSWDISDDGLAYTFHLRHDVRFHDGVPMTAADVKFSFEGIMHPDYGGNQNTGFDGMVGYDAYHSGKASEVTGLKVLDDYTVRFQMTAPNASFFMNSLVPASIIPQHLWGSVPVADWGTSKDPANAHPIGTGPFMWGSVAANQFYELVRYDAYHLGAPYADRLIWKVLPQETGVAYLQTSEVDIADVKPADLAKMSTYSNITTDEIQDLSYQAFWMNTRRGPFSEKTVRQAADFAINKPAIINDLLKGHASQMYTTIHPLTWAYTDDVEHYDFNPDKAKALLDSAGWVAGASGIREKNGQKLHIAMYYPTGNPVRMQFAPMIAKWLRDVGFEVDLQKVDFTSLINRTSNSPFDFDAALYGYTVAVDPDQLWMWSKEQIGDGLNNATGWTNPDAESLLHRAVATSDIDQRKALYTQWSKIYAEEVPTVLLYGDNKLYGVNNRVHNFKPGPNNYYWNAYEWWVDG